MVHCSRPLAPYLKVRCWAKTVIQSSCSERLVPLVGSSKWAAERILAQSTESRFAFPNYNDGKRTNANSASAALNKWLKSKIGRGYTIHSFRHSMRDRLRAVECPSEIIDQIGGWLTNGVGISYGNGCKTLAVYK